MNSHIIFGTFTFLGWAVFSTWYYVNFIKDLTPSQNNSETSIEVVLEEQPDQTQSEKPKSTPINISRNVLFEKNSVILSNTGSLELLLDSILMASTDQELFISVEGHACDLGTSEYNLNLSEDRANTISEIIKTFDGRLVVDKLDFAGESDPYVPNTSEENRIKNRRVQIKITTKL